MGVERVLQAAGWLTLLVALAVAAPSRRERIAIIDLGPPDPQARQKLAAAAVDGGLDPLLSDGIADALAGESHDPDAAQLRAALADAQRAYGALDCKATLAASKTAIGLAAARQASGLPVPELARALTYVLLCADRAGDVDAAMAAAAHLRTLGRSAAEPGDVPPELWAKYPEVDVMIDRDMIPVELRADVAGAELWVDFQRAGTSPLHTALPAGEHVIAAATGARRGWAAGTVVRSQPVVVIPTSVQRGPHAHLAARIAGWKGAVPPPAELAVVLDEVNARVAILRRGDRIEAWGRAAHGELPRRLGGDDGVGTLDEAGRLVSLIQDRVRIWTERAPDPDVPLLVEERAPRTRREGARADEPTRWWVYAALGAALAASAGVLYIHETRTDTQRIELRWP